jgi:hypothetical protein
MEIERHLTEINEEKIAAANMNLDEIPEGIRDLVLRKREIYARTNELRQENVQVEATIIDRLTADSALLEQLKLRINPASLLCW